MKEIEILLQYSITVSCTEVPQSINALNQLLETKAPNAKALHSNNIGNIAETKTINMQRRPKRLGICAKA